MSGSLPGTWTGTDTPGEIRPVACENNAEIFRLVILCNLRAIVKKRHVCLIYNRSKYEIEILNKNKLNVKNIELVYKYISEKVKACHVTCDFRAS